MSREEALVAFLIAAGLLAVLTGLADWLWHGYRAMSVDDFNDVEGDQ